MEPFQYTCKHDFSLTRQKKNVFATSPKKKGRESGVVVYGWLGQLVQISPFKN